MINAYSSITQKLGKFSCAIFFVLIAFASQTTLAVGPPITGVKNIPGDYPTLKDAIDTLNANGVGTGGVTLNLLAGNPETAPAGGYVINAAGNLSDQIIIQGNANVITANSALTAGSLTDAIFKLVGADYVTITGFVMQENAANTTTASASNNMTEWGVALLYATTTNGSQNNTIQGNTISLSRAYPNSFGIYSNTRHNGTSVTTIADITNNTTAPNSNNKVYGNTISNVNMGIAFIGSGVAANMDFGNDIGGSSAATGNTITNWGGAAATGGFISNSGTSYCIFMNHQTGDNISYNAVTSAAVSGTAVTFRGIFKEYTAVAPAGTFTSSVTSNTVTLNSGFTSGTFEAIRSQNGAGGAVAGVTLNISGNFINNCAITGASSSSAMVCIVNSFATGTLSITNNIIRGNTSTATSGGFTGISNTGAVVNAISIISNQVGSAGGNAITFSAATSGAVIAITNSGGANTCALAIQSNDIRGIVHAVAGSSTHTYITNTAATLSQNISNNTFSNLNVNTTGSVTFISNSVSLSATGAKNINGNSIITAFNKGGSGGTVTFYSDAASSVTGAVSNANNNNFSNITVTGATTISGWSNADGVSSTSAAAKTFTGNTFSNITGGTSAVTLTSFSFGGNTNNISNNTFSNVTNGAAITALNLGSSNNGLTVLSNTVTGLSTSTGTVIGITTSSSGTNGATLSQNIITSLATGGASSAVIGLGVGGGTNVTVSNNTINTLTTSGTTSPQMYGINSTLGTTVTLVGNVINGLSGSGATAPVAAGIQVTGGGTVNVSKNKIFDVVQTAALSGATVGVNGILITNGTTVNASNNLIGNLRAPASTQTEAIRGISVTSTTGATNYNIYYNTVYLNAASSGANFGTTGMFHTASATATTAALTLRNNIIINNSTANGTGLTVAYRRSSATLANYTTASNNNIFYAGTPGAANLIFADGTNSNQTLAAFQTLVGPTRETASKTENTVFLSTTGTSSSFLHVDPSIQTYAESGAANIASYTDDYDGDIRQGNAGYTGTGTAPDIGADEFNGTVPTACAGTPTAGSITGATSVCQNNGTTLSLSGPPSSGLGITWQWASSTTAGGPYTNLGTNYTQATGNLSATTFYIVTVTCANSGSSATTAEFTVSVNPNPTVTVSPTSGVVCLPGGSGVTLTAGGANTYAWSPVSGLSATTGSTVTATPTVATVYSVTGTNGVGCSNTATTAISVAAAVSITSIAANPAAVCSGGTSTLTVIASLNNSYCASTHSSGCSSGADAMTNVLLGTLNNTSTCGTGFYTYYNGGGSQTTTLTAGSTYTISASFGSDPNQYFGAWIDFNQDGTLSTTEFLGASANAGASGTTTITFTVPAGATNGVTRLRVIGGNDSPPTNAQACGASSSAFGETEDYDVTITGGVNAITYAWSPATFLNTTAGSPVIASSVTATTTYSATATSSAGCTATGTVTLSAGSPLTSTAGVTPSATVCAGTTFTLTSSPSGGGAPYTYAWSGPNSFTSTAQNPSVSASVSSAGVYTITVTDNCGAPSTNTVNVTVNPQPSLTVTPTTGTICLPGGSPVSLSVSGANTYSWSPATGLSSTTSASPTANPTITTVYSVTGTGLNGCKSVASAMVTVAPAVTLGSVLATPASVCSGGTSTLTVNASLNNSYCSSTHSSGCSGGADAMTNVLLGTLSNPSACGTGFYTYYNGGGAQTTTLTAGSTYTLSASFGSDPNQYFGAWIDFNQDGTLATTEFLGASANAGGSGTTTITFTVPAGAINGKTRLRVIGGNDSPLTSAQACGASSSSFGETEDYDVVITGGTNSGGFTYSWSPATFLNTTSGSPVIASSVTTTTTYSATATSSAGCSATGTVTLVSGTPLSSTASVTPSGTVCAGTTLTFSSVPAGGGAPYTYAWSGPNSFTSTVASPILTASVPASGVYTITVTDNCAATSTNTVDITVNPQPSLTLTPTTGTICLPGGSPISLSVSGANSYSWSPAAGLSSSTSANPTANPTVSTVYVVTGTDANNCTATANATITVGQNPTITSITATPASICSGGSSQLNVGTGSTTYNQAIVPFAPIASGTGTTILCSAGTASTALTGGTLDDGYWNNLAIPFAFNYYGTSYSTLNVQTNGAVSFSPFTTTTGYNVTLPTTAVPNNFIASCFGDLDWRFGGRISCYTSGTAPNRIFVINYDGSVGSGAGFYTGSTPTTTVITQVQLFETSNNIEVHTTLVSTNTTNHSEGIENAAGTSAVVVSGRNNTTWSTTNDAVQFAVPTNTYSWTPGSFLNNTTISNPVASGMTSTTNFSVTVTSSAGCVSSGTVAVNVDPLSTLTLTATPGTTVCSGTPVTIASSITGGGLPYTYSWSPGGQTTPSVTVTPSSSTVYTLTVTDNCSVTATETIAITVNPLPSVSVVSTSTLYCNPGTGVTLTASGASTYSWSPAVGLSSTSGATVTATPSVTTTYSVIGTDGNGCTNMASMSITSAPGVTGVSASATPSVVCAGTPITLGSSAGTYSVTLLAENFNTTAPGWTMINNSTAGTSTLAAAWTLRPDGYVYSGNTFHSNDNSQFIQTNSDAQGSGGTTLTMLQSPAFNTTGLSNLSLSFYQYYRSLSDSAIVEASTNGSTWTKIGAYTATVGAVANFVQSTLTIPPAFNNQSTVYVRFRYRSAFGWYWSIDNVSVTGSSSSYTYNWSSAPGGFTSTQQNPGTVTPTVSTTYSVDIANIYGCVATATAAVTVNPMPVVNLGNDTTFCGSSLPLDAGNAGSTYVWNDLSTAQTLTATASGQYYVTVTTAQNCTNSDTINVVINPIPVVNLGPDTTRCGGTVLLNAGNAGSTYLWSDASTSQTLLVNTSGTYYVTVTNSVSCSSGDTINVTINSVPVVNLGNDTMICGGSLTLNAGNAGATYLWSTAAATQTISVNATGSYFVDVTTSQGCTSRDTITVTVNPAVVVNLGNDTALCTGNSLILDAQNPGATYLWSDNSTASILVVNSPGTYFVSVSYTTGCSGADTILVTNGTPTVSLTLATNTVCANGAPVTLSGGSPASGTYSGNGVTGGTFNPSVAGTGTVSITYSYTDSNSGCSNSASDVMTVVASPTVSLMLPIDSICSNASPITLSGGSPASGTYSGSGVTAGSFDPSVAGVGVVTITYAYTDGTTGCSNTATDNVNVQNCIGVQQFANVASLQVYPNPTSGTFTIELPDAAQRVKAILHSAEGKMIFNDDLTGKTKFVYDIDKLGDGVYYLELRSADGVRVVKLVKQF